MTANTRGPEVSSHRFGSDFEALRGPLTGFFKRKSPDHDDIADLVQEVFLRLAARDPAEPIKNLHGYALQVAANVLTDRHRRRAVRQHDAHVGFDEAIVDEADIPPDRILEGRSSLHAVLGVLDALPQRTRTIFVLRRLEGMRYREIAERLGLSVSAVEKHMVRAVEHLAQSRGQA